MDSNDDPNAAADLSVYRAQYGLPARTTANGRFREVAQDGGTNYPALRGSWTALPGSGNADYRGGGACGFFGHRRGRAERGRSLDHPARRA